MFLSTTGLALGFTYRKVEREDKEREKMKEGKTRGIRRKKIFERK